MFTEHDLPLTLAYLVGLGGWLAAARLVRATWPGEAAPPFEHPWREFGIALLGTLGILAVGQLWSAGIRLPEEGAFRLFSATINQILIFSPLLLLLLLRRQPWTSAWLPRERPIPRLLTGIVLGSVAVTAYSLLRVGADPPWVMVGRIWRFGNIDKMVQVFLEDLTIAILFVRLAGAIGKRWSTVVVACLFSLGHIPAMVSHGATGPELLGLVRDAGLGVAVILVLQRSRDVVWFWCLHYCLDMTQFSRISGIPGSGG